MVLSGPSGSGKSTVVDRVIGECPVRLMKVVSATTRPARQREVHGVDYYFISPEEFSGRRDRGEFVECEEVFSAGYWYGTLKSEVQRAAEQGAWAFLEIDVRGAMKVVEAFPSALTIFLKTPSESVFEQRLRSRGTESEESIQRRLKAAREELKSAGRYRHQVCNDTLDRAVAEIIQIIQERETALHA